MGGDATNGSNRSLIDDPTFLSYLDDLDRGLRTVRTNDGADDEGELPVDCSPAPPPPPSRTPGSPPPGMSRPPTRAVADDPNLRANLEVIDWGLADDGGPLRAPAAWSAPEPSEAAAGGRPLLDLFPVGPANATRAMTLPPAQKPTGPLRRDVSEAAMRPFSDASEDDDDMEDSYDPAVRGGERPDGRARQLKGFGFVAFLLVMMLLGASIGALVFHAQVSRIIVKWQSVSASPPPPTATHAIPD
jgi:hypothetical protein